MPDTDTDTDIACRIGPDWGTLTPAQRDRLTRLDADLATRKPILGIELRTAAVRAVVRWWRGEITLEDAGAVLADARREEERARAVVRALGVSALGEGRSQSGTAAALGIDRMALLKWAGLRD
ncbi:hypothetical protein [Nocardia paucivorans]|uniref:hypothetical protein n=1 Tax=Nocardia paucivorans TaxID=114259 RepID=UPI00031B0B7F|nr:hypothetical protein [Nocardia paucivorans]